MINFPERFTISWIRNAYISGGLEPEALLDEIISRAEREKERNIWIIPPSRELSLKYIEALPGDRTSLPLWGIPFAIKDNVDLAGTATTAGCPAYAYVTEHDAETVRKLIAAGAIPIGKTNMDQFATGLVGTRSPYGEVHNAFDHEMISGGSSAGSAVCTALGMAAFALGTDTAGSGRVPAMLNSLIGYKPPIGAWSAAGVVPACESLDCVTVFTNELRDAFTVNELVRGFDCNYRWSRVNDISFNMPQTVYIPDVDPKFFGEDAGIYRSKWENCIERAAAVCEDHKIKLVKTDMSMFNEAALILYEGSYVAERWEALGCFVESHPGEIFQVTEKVLRSGVRAENTAVQLFKDMHRLKDYKNAAHRLLENAVMIMPTAGGSFTRDEVRRDPIRTNSMMGLYTNHCNLLDLAAIAVPENAADRELPFGITIFGRYDREGLVCKFAEAFMDKVP